MLNTFAGNRCITRVMFVYVKQRPKSLRRLDFDYILSGSGICPILHTELKGASMGHSFIKEAEGESVKENKNGMVKGKWIKSRGMRGGAAIELFFSCTGCQNHDLVLSMCYFRHLSTFL